VVIDGLDASGKDTQALQLCGLIRKQGKSVYLRLHPATDNLFGIRARQFLYSRGKSAHLAAALFYMMDVIRSVLLYSWRNYDFLIFVRYLMGTAYLPEPLHIIAYCFFSQVVPISEFMFFLDVDPCEAVRRLRETREKLEMFENLEQLEQTRQKAVYLATMGNWRIVNANRPTKSVQEAIRKSMQV
jgi:dTMP kinase